MYVYKMYSKLTSNHDSGTCISIAYTFIPYKEGLWRLTTQYSSYVVAVSFIDGGHRSSWKKHRPATSH